MSRPVRVVFAALVAAAVLSAIGRPAFERVSRRLSGTLTLATLNVQTLFDAHYDGGEFDEFNPYASDWNVYAYRERLQVLADAITALTPVGPPDVLVLQEIEHDGVLDDLIEVLGRDRYPQALCAPGPTAMRVCVASRLPVVAARSHGQHAGESTPAGLAGEDYALRSMLELTLDSPGGAFRVIAAHWKSPREGVRATAPLRRLAAQAARRRLDMLRLENPEARFILAGDLNMEIGADGYGEPPIMADDPRALLRVLPIPGTRPERGPFDGATEDVVHRESGHGDGNANHGAVLHSPWDGLGEGSYVFRGEPRAVDHLLFSPAFFHGSEGLRYESTRLVREWADGSGAPRRYESFRQAGVTDHFALVARLSTRRSAGPGEGG